MPAVCDASDQDHPENWTFQLFWSWKGPPYGRDFRSPEDRLRYLQEQLSPFCEPWRTAVLALEPDDAIPVDVGAQFSPDKANWDNHGGRLSLAGDAAHAMMPREDADPFQAVETDLLQTGDKA
jgi:2-polyprenyl-6-methoxyphenol hydroxylase-like FAD-dependent oxidoreductase